MTFTKYLAIQLLAYVIDMFFFTVSVNMLFINPITSNICGKIAAGIFAFFLHRIFTFNIKTKKIVYQQAILYFSFLFLNIPLSSLIFIFNLSWIPNRFLAKFISDVVLFGLSYFLSKFLVFKDNHFKIFF